MKRISTFLALVSLVLFPISSSCLAESLSLPQNTQVKVCFSPKGGCTDAIVSEIDHAKTENLLIIMSKELVSFYLENWQKHKDHSEIYQR